MAGQKVRVCKVENRQDAFPLLEEGTVDIAVFEYNSLTNLPWCQVLFADSELAEQVVNRHDLFVLLQNTAFGPDYSVVLAEHNSMLPDGCLYQNVLNVLEWLFRSDLEVVSI